jgi:hypothetical protein
MAKKTPESKPIEIAGWAIQKHRGRLCASICIDGRSHSIYFAEMDDIEKRLIEKEKQIREIYKAMHPF